MYSMMTIANPVPNIDHLLRVDFRCPDLRHTQTHIK